MYTCQKDCLEIFCVFCYFKQPPSQDSLQSCLPGRGNHSAMIIYPRRTWPTTLQITRVDTPHVMIFFPFISVSTYIADSHLRKSELWQPWQTGHCQSVVNQNGLILLSCCMYWDNQRKLLFADKTSFWREHFQHFMPSSLIQKCHSQRKHQFEAKC